MIKSLHSCRGISCVLICFVHLGGAIASEKYFNVDLFQDLFSFGACSVEFFFVLSGFIIFYVHRKELGQSKAVKSYVLKRLIRIYPIYLIVFTFAYLFALTLPQFNNTISSVSVLIQSVLLLPQNKATIGGTGAPIIIVAWTLQVEIVFYFIFLFFLLSKRYLFILIPSILILFFSKKMGMQYTFYLDFISSEYILLFFIGGLASYVLESKKKINQYPGVLICIGFVFYFLSVGLLLLDFRIFAQLVILLYGMSFSCIILSLVLFEKEGIVFLGNSFFQMLGAISFSLYLVHYPLISFLCKVSMFLNLKSLGLLGATVSFISIFSLCVFTAWLIHRYVERVIIKKLRMFFLPSV